MKSGINKHFIIKNQGGISVLTQIIPFIDPHRHERNPRIKLLEYEIIIVMDESNFKISRETNKVNMMCFKTITACFSTIICILVEPITYLAKTKPYLEASISIRVLYISPSLDSSIS